MTTATATAVNAVNDDTLRPDLLADFTGQIPVKVQLRTAIDASILRGEPLDHVMFYGPSGHGKCITEDSILLTDHGMIDFTYMKAKEIPYGSQAETLIEIDGINGRELASHVYHNGPGETIKIVNRLGFSIEGRPAHPLLVLTENNLVWKTLDEIQIGDHVAVSQNNNLFGSTIFKADYVNEKSLLRNNLIRMRTLKAYEIFVKLTDKLPTVPDVIKIATGQSSQNSAIFDAIKFLKLPMSKSKRNLITLKNPERHYVPVDLPVHKINLCPDIGYLLGMITGDAHIAGRKGPTGPYINVTCGDKETVTELQRISKNVFGFAPAVKKHKNRTPYVCFYQNVTKTLMKFGLKSVNAFDKTIPDAVLQSPREVIIGYVQGLMDADGGVIKIGDVEFGSRSERLCTQLQIVLANFGIIAVKTFKIVKDKPFWLLNMNGEAAIKYNQLIGFRLTRKSNRVKNACKRDRGWRLCELIPYAGNTLERIFRRNCPQPRIVHKLFGCCLYGGNKSITKQQAVKLLKIVRSWNNPDDSDDIKYLNDVLNDKFVWSPVVSKVGGYADTFDLCVPGSHSFTANGLVNHNTSLARILANEMQATMIQVTGSNIKDFGSLVKILKSLKECDILFIDEIHGLKQLIEEPLYSALEGFKVETKLSNGTMYSIPVKPFTMVGATTMPGRISEPLRTRIPLKLELKTYNQSEIAVIITSSANRLGFSITNDAALDLAGRCRGVPRTANSLIRRVRDIAQNNGTDSIDLATVDKAMLMMGIDKKGLEEQDRRLLSILLERFGGRPAGIHNITSSMGVDIRTLEQLIEPYLLQIGFIERVARGRQVTGEAAEWLNTYQAQMS